MEGSRYKGRDSGERAVNNSHGGELSEINIQVFSGYHIKYGGLGRERSGPEEVMDKRTTLQQKGVLSATVVVIRMGAEE